MGNCMRVSRSRQVEEEEELEAEVHHEEETEFEKKVENYENIRKGSVKVKIVLTKEELELFLMKLKDNKGGNKSLEQLLSEMEKARAGGGKVDSWRPSLESIMEDDELRTT
ncbi:hypothetical protein CCACVL1_13443 [Corchorus capsularis]|uniref:Uncharacterized protein n=1 Tax=Corchorus capsularis TaxID=210143 RepID=A0A1R3IB20_COCAP|nr:hypothetical protein CCACVL1_13443 [Corchorus capsularis]